VRIALHPQSLAALYAAGWTNSRRTDVSHIVSDLSAAGYTVDDYMTDILSSLNGIVVVPVPQAESFFANEDSLIIDPLGVGTRHRSEAKDLEEWFGYPFCPLGWWLCRSHVYFSADGVAVASLPDVIWLLGDSFESAVDFMLLGNRPLERLWSLDGMDV
jgi:hypothetical protein